MKSKLCLVYAAAVLLFPIPVLAAGMFVPDKSFGVMPAIPNERALIAWRDGKESLVVETEFQTNASDVVWMVPVPSAPTRLQVMDGGFLTSLTISMDSQVVPDMPGLWKVPLAVLALLLPMSIVAIICVRPGTRALLFLIVFVVFLAGLGLASALSAQQSQGVMSVYRQPWQRLGDYDVAVLDPGVYNGAQRWLIDHDMRKPEPAVKASLDYYANNGWYILVARLHRGLSSVNAGVPIAPHPIAVSFNSPQAVYPLIFTHHGNTNTHFDLCFVGDQQAQIDGFQCVAADRFFPVHWRDNGPLDTTIADGYQSERVGQTIGSPDVCEWLWKGCTITRLVADLPPSKMTADPTIQWTPLSPQRASLYGAQIGPELGVGALLAGICIAVFYAGRIFNARRRPAWAQLQYLLIRIPFFVAAVTVLLWTGFAGEPVHRYPLPDDTQRIQTLQVAKTLMDQGKLGPQFEFRQRAALMRELTQKGLDVDIYTATAVRPERSPGNFAVRSVGTQSYFCVYDVDGREYRMAFP